MGLTIFFCLCTLLLCAPVAGGFMVVLAAPAFAGIVIHGLVVALNHPPRRRDSLIRIGVVLATVASICGIHLHYARSARSDANEVVGHIRAYQAQHGHYPDTLEEAGTSATPRGRHWNIMYSPDTHEVTYFGTWRIYEYCLLRLDGGDWRCGGD